MLASQLSRPRETGEDVPLSGRVHVPGQVIDREAKRCSCW
jgi:hypothetical protein